MTFARAAPTFGEWRRQDLISRAGGYSPDDIENAPDPYQVLAGHTNQLMAAKSVLFIHGAGGVILLPDVFSVEQVLKVAAAMGASGDVREFVHSEDFRSVRWGEERFTFTPSQALVVKLLHAAYEEGVPDLTQEHIFDMLRGDGRPLTNPRLRDAFKSHPAWGRLIIPGEKRGLYRLAI